MEARNWYVGYRGGFELGPLHLPLKSGRILGLVGRNGSGKTTLLESLVGLMQPFHGELRVFGSKMKPDDYAWKKELAYVPQIPQFYSRFTVGQYLKFMAGLFPTWSWERCRDMVETCRIPLKAKPEALSKGQRTALATVAALSHQPRILILDEPTAGLDPVIRTKILDWILDLVNRQPDGTVLITTHILSDIAKIVDEVAFMIDHTIDTRLDRDQLEDQWRRVTFRHEGPSLMLPGALEVQRQGDLYLVLTDRFEILQEALQLHGITPRETYKLSLEEAAVHILEGSGA